MMHTRTRYQTHILQCVVRLDAEARGKEPRKRIRRPKHKGFPGSLYTWLADATSMNGTPCTHFVSTCVISVLASETLSQNVATIVPTSAMVLCRLAGDVESCIKNVQHGPRHLRLLLPVLFSGPCRVKKNLKAVLRPCPSLNRLGAIASGLVFSRVWRFDPK